MSDTPTQGPDNGRELRPGGGEGFARGVEPGATVAYTGSGSDEAALGGLAKLERDLAFAVTVVRARRLTERDLSRVVASWTIHGSESLVDCLIRHHVIEEAEAQRFVSAAARLVDLAHAAASEDGRDLTSTAHSGRAFARIDPDGRLARLLGLSSGAELLEGQEVRQLASRFSLIRKLGEGGLGTVWLARDENLNRYVAVKEIKDPERADEFVLARFRREAEVTGRLEHPSIVPVYQYGRDGETGGYFYAMRFLGKHTLQDGIAEYHEQREAGHDDAMLLHRLLNAFVSLCQAVAHAHSRQIIHRDLKPENVAFDEFGKVILLDWGLAKIHSETGVYDAAGKVEPADVMETGIRGQVVGTPMYMAPEQAAGRLDDIDERTDVYGLGGVLFAILTGNAPHEITHAGVSSRGPVSEILAAIVDGPTLSPRAIVPTVAPELEAICTKALAKKRFLRYQTAVSLAEEVERYLAGEPVDAYDEPPSKRARRWIGNHPRLTQVLAVVLFVLLATGVTLAISAQQRHVLVERARFEMLEDAVRKLEILLQAKAAGLAQDTRFASELPPIQEIINHRRVPDATTTPADLVKVPEPAETEDVWKVRLASIFSGLMRGHPEYQILAYIKLDESAARELVRCERNSATGRIIRVPEGRLAEFSAGAGLQAASNLTVGDVLLKTGQQIETEAEARFRSPRNLIALTPVFDEHSGRLFGFAVIVVDLAELIDEQLFAVNRDTVDLTITDAEGKPILYYEHGVPYDQEVDGPSIVERVPATKALFGPERTRSLVHDGTSIYAARVILNPGEHQVPCELGLLAEEAEDD